MRSAAILLAAALLACGGDSSSREPVEPAPAEPTAGEPATPVEPPPAETEPPAAEPTAGPPAPEQRSAAAEEARQVFTYRCVVCHGESGRGDGKASVGLEVKPRNWTDTEWQASVTDERLAKVIVGGGAAVGLSPLMVPNPDLEQKPEVLRELIAIVRSFGRQP